MVDRNTAAYLLSRVLASLQPVTFFCNMDSTKGVNIKNVNPGAAAETAAEMTSLAKYRRNSSL